MGTKPYIDRIEYFFIRGDKARLSALEKFKHESGYYARTYLEHTKYYKPETVQLIPKHDPKKAMRLIRAFNKRVKGIKPNNLAAVFNDHEF